MLSVSVQIPTDWFIEKSMEEGTQIEAGIPVKSESGRLWIRWR